MALECLPGLGGAVPCTPSGDPPHLTEQDDGQPDGEEGESELVLGTEERQGSGWLEEQLIGREPGEDESQQRRPEASIPCREVDGEEEGDEGKAVPRRGSRASRIAVAAATESSAML